MIKSLVSQFNESFENKEHLLDKNVFQESIESCFALSQKALEELKDVSDVASKESYFDLFTQVENISLFKNKNTSNMMWHQLIKEQEQELKNYIVVANLNAQKEEDKVEYNHEFLFERFTQMDGWQEFDLQNKEIDEETEQAPMGALDAIFFAAPTTPTDIVNNFKIKNNNTDTYVEFKMGDCIEHSVFNLEEEFFLSYLNLGNKFERINILKKIDDSWFQFFIAKNEKFNEAQVFKIDLNGNLSQSSDCNSLYFMEDLNQNVSIFRKHKHIIGEIQHFNSELFKYNDDSCEKVANSLMIEYINQDGYNLFKRNKTLGYDFYLDENEDIKSMRIQKVLSNRELTVSDQFWKKDYGIRANRITSEVFLNNMILLTETNSPEINHFLFNQKQELRIPNVDRFFDSKYSDMRKVFEGDEMRLLSLDALDYSETKVADGFAKEILKNKNIFFTVIDSHEMVNFVSYGVNVVKQEDIDSIQFIQDEITPNILNEYSFFLKDINLFYDKKVKFYSPIGFITIFKDECHKYNNLNVPKDLIAKYKLTPVLGHSYAYDKRLFNKNNLIKELISLGAKEATAEVINYQEYKKDNMIIKREHETDEGLINFKITIGDEEYFDKTNSFEDFQNEYLMESFHEILSESVELDENDKSSVKYFMPDPNNLNTFLIGVNVKNIELIERITLFLETFREVK